MVATFDGLAFPDDAAVGEVDLLSHLGDPIPPGALDRRCDALGADIGFGEGFLVEVGHGRDGCLLLSTWQPAAYAECRANARLRIDAVGSLSYCVRRSHSSVCPISRFDLAGWVRFAGYGREEWLRIEGDGRRRNWGNWAGRPRVSNHTRGHPAQFPCWTG